MCTALSGGMNYTLSKKEKTSFYLFFSQMPQFDTNYPCWHDFSCCRIIAEHFGVGQLMRLDIVLYITDKFPESVPLPVLVFHALHVMVF